MELRFESKKDGWLGVVNWVGVIATLFGAGVVAVTPGPLLPRVALSLLLVGVAALPLWIWYGTDYRLDDRELRVRCGPFRFRVELAAIREVCPSTHVISSPALSLDRLLLRTGEGPDDGLLVSPEPRDAFLAALAERAGLVRHAERWVRPSQPER